MKIVRNVIHDDDKIRHDCRLDKQKATVEAGRLLFEITKESGTVLKTDKLSELLIDRAEPLEVEQPESAQR